MHPSAIIKGAHAEEPFQVRHLGTALRVASEGVWWVEDMGKVPPGKANLFPTFGELERFFLLRTGNRLYCDIECAGPHLVCIGFYCATTDYYICMRFRDEGGAVWEPDTLEARAELLFSVLSSPHHPKVFHNGQAFDIPYLEDMGFEVNGYVNDTMLMAHVAYAEHKKSLEFLAFNWADMLGWKDMLDENDEEEGK
jgi:hypothetical protein